jgi:N-acetylglutamate synthase-like GNAT family acetyltransferase
LGRSRTNCNKFLHVSNAYRKSGVGKRLYELARAKARERGARQMYISATPFENTVKFYQRRGCRLAQERDPELSSSRKTSTWNVMYRTRLCKSRVVVQLE